MFSKKSNVTSDAPKYKTLTIDDVKTVLVKLLDENETTTNLDIKNALREDGFFATQEAVSQFTNELYANDDPEGLDYSANGQYRTYFIGDSSDDEDLFATDDDEDDWLNVSDDEDDQSAPALITVPQDDEDDQIQQDPEFGNWEVWDKDNELLSNYFYGVTRNQARYSFAKENNIEYTDTRSKKVK